MKFVILFLVFSTVANVDEAQIPQVAMSVSVYPNPMLGSSRIALSTNKAERIRVDIYDLKGRLVNRLYDAHLSSGSHELVWNGNSKQGNALSSGIYFIKCSSGNSSITHKVIVLR